MQQDNNGYPTQGQGQPVMPSFSSSGPSRHRNRLLIPLILCILLFFATLAFGLWAFGERSTYKNQTDKIVKEEADKAKAEVSAAKDAEFAEKEKSPNQEYKGPDAFGSVRVLYPKTWSAYVAETDKSTTPVDGYFNPVFVPGVQSGAAMALRLKVVDADYATELKKFETGVKSGKVKVSAVVAKNVPTVTGSRIDGEIATGKQGSIVMFPLRDKTLVVSTEAQQFVGDFDSIILPNLSFAP